MWSTLSFMVGVAASMFSAGAAWAGRPAPAATYAATLFVLLGCGLRIWEYMDRERRGDNGDGS